MSYLQNIPRFSGSSNLGGLIDIRVIRKSDVVSTLLPVNGIIYGNIEFKPGVSGFAIWHSTLEKASLESRGQRTREGEKKDTRLRISIPKDNPSIRHMLEQATRDEFIVMYRDSSGNQKIAGLPQAPMLFTFDHSSNSQFSEGNFYHGSFYYEGPDNTFFYDGSVGTPPVGTGNNLVYFNNEVIAVLGAGQNFHIESDFGFTNFYTT